MGREGADTVFHLSALLQSEFVRVKVLPMFQRPLVAQVEAARTLRIAVAGAVEYQFHLQICRYQSVELHHDSEMQ